MTNEEVHKIIYLSQQNLTYSEIAEAVNFCERYIMGVTSSLGIHRKRGRRSTPGLKVKIINLYADGYSKTEIARKLRIDRKTVYNYLRRCNEID